MFVYMLWLISFIRQYCSGFILKKVLRQRVTNKLHVTDLRTHRAYEIPIQHNSVRAIDFLRISTLGLGASLEAHYGHGLQILDPGFRNTAVMESKITHM